MGKRTLKEQIPAFASVAGLLVLIATYYIIGGIKDANVAYGLKAVVSSTRWAPLTSAWARQPASARCWGPWPTTPRAA